MSHKSPSPNTTAEAEGSPSPPGELVAPEVHAGQERVIYTVGHSTRTVPELVKLLRDQGATLLIDIRTVPKSRTNPQWNNAPELARQLSESGVGHAWLGKELGGLRKPDCSSTANLGWENESFRGYADYMQTPAFASGLARLEALALSQGPAALMCAEVVHFRCHRSLLSDALASRGWSVRHILSAGKPPLPHKVTSFAHVRAGGRVITYPAYQKEGGQAGRKGGKRKADQEPGQKAITGFFPKKEKEEGHGRHGGSGPG